MSFPTQNPFSIAKRRSSSNFGAVKSQMTMEDKPLSQNNRMLVSFLHSSPAFSFLFLGSWVFVLCFFFFGFLRIIIRKLHLLCFFLVVCLCKLDGLFLFFQRKIFWVYEIFVCLVSEERK